MRRLVLLLLVAASPGFCADAPEYRFAFTVDIDGDDDINLSASVPAGDRKVVPVNSTLQFEVTTPPGDGMPTAVRLVDLSGGAPKTLHTMESDWPASFERNVRYQLCEGVVVGIYYEVPNDRGVRHINVDPIAPMSAKCKDDIEARIYRPPPDWRTLQDMSDYFAEVRSAESVVIFGGLSSELDQAAYERELKRADVIRIEAFPFYKSPYKASSRESAALTATALSDDAHLRYRGPPMCGFYHPDVAIVWQHGEEESGALICLGCWQVIYFTPRGRLIENLGATAYQEFKTVVTRIRTGQPIR